MLLSWRGVGVLPPVGPSRVFTFEGKSCASVTELPGISWGVAGKSPVGLQAQELILDVSP